MGWDGMGGFTIRMFVAASLLVFGVCCSLQQGLKADARRVYVCIYVPTYVLLVLMHVCMVWCNFWSFLVVQPAKKTEKIRETEEVGAVVAGVRGTRVAYSKA